MRTGFVLIIILLSSGIFSQKEVLEFKLSKPENGIQINMVDSVFQLGDVNPFEVVSTGGEPIVKVEVFRGKVFQVPLGWYEATFKQAGPSFIKVYAKNSKGETYVALTKAVMVQPFPSPNIYICDVKQDSALNIEHLVKSRTISAKMKNPGKYEYHPSVLGFSFELGNDTIQVNGNEIPFHYKSRLLELKNGDVFTLLDVKVMLPTPNKNIITIPKVSVFLINTDQYSVGERKYIIRD